LFVNNNFLSLGVLLAIKDLGLRCPEDIAIVGFDDHPWAAISDPPLTVVWQPVRELGQMAAQTLCVPIRGDQPPQSRVMLECEVILRQSRCPAH